MSYQQENFGMMDEGYFVPRTQIIAWVNTLLDLNISKIQQLGSGAVYCQVIDVIHPGKIALGKVNWKAKNDYEFINNLKILQNAFDKIGIKRHVEVEKLARAKYQDNLEFIQWLKRYFDVNCGERGNNYMAQQRRGNVVVDLSFAEKNVVPKTFNSGGQVKNSQVFEKKRTSAKKEEAPIVKVSGKKSTKVLESIPETSNTNKSNVEEEIEYYKSLGKKCQMKIDMVLEILKTEDSSQMKLKMIEEIVRQE